MEASDEFNTRVCGKFGIDRIEERRTEAQRHRAADHGALEVHDRSHACKRPTDLSTNELLRGKSRLRGRFARDRLDRSTGRMCLETPSCATCTEPAVGLDDHVADVPRISRAPRDESSLTHDASTDTSGHDHADDIRLPAGGATPHFAEDDCVRVVGDEDVEPRRMPQSFS